MPTSSSVCSSSRNTISPSTGCGTAASRCPNARNSRRTNGRSVRSTGSCARLGAQRDTVLADEKRLDDEAQSLGAHVTEVDQKLYSGTISSPRELQAMQADIDMLKRHQRDLEDRELDVMEQRETLDTEIAKAEGEREQLGAEVARLQSTVAGVEAEIDAEVADETAARAELVAGVAPSLIQDYERRRAKNRGAGAARLVGTTCQACHLTIPSTEAERIRRAAGEEVAYCDNCSAILVP